MSAERGLYGGQAVIEGVMMRGPRRMAIAVRRPDGSTAIHQEEIASAVERYPALRLPVLRGMVALVETGLGIRALVYSANQAVPEEGQLSQKELTSSATWCWCCGCGTSTGSSSTTVPSTR